MGGDQVSGTPAERTWAPDVGEGARRVVGKAGPPQGAAGQSPPKGGERGRRQRRADGRARRALVLPADPGVGDGGLTVQAFRPLQVFAEVGPSSHTETGIAPDGAAEETPSPYGCRYLFKGEGGSALLPLLSPATPSAAPPASLQENKRTKRITLCPAFPGR